MDHSPTQEAVLAEHEELDHRRKALTGAINVLNPRERRIFEARRLADDPMTLEDLASEFGVSRERVRQIEVRAFEKVQIGSQRSIHRRQRKLRFTQPTETLTPHLPARYRAATRKAGGNAGFACL